MNLSSLTSLGSFVNPWIIILAIVTHGYAFYQGHEYGYSRGYTSAKDEAKAQIEFLNNELVTMREAENQRRNEAAERIAGLEQAAHAAAEHAYAMEKERTRVAADKVIEWRTKIVPGKCGLTSPSVDLLNSILDLK